MYTDLHICIMSHFEPSGIHGYKMPRRLVRKSNSCKKMRVVYSTARYVLFQCYYVFLLMLPYFYLAEMIQFDLDGRMLFLNRWGTTTNEIRYFGGYFSQRVSPRNMMGKEDEKLSFGVPVTFLFARQLLLLTLRGA